MTVVLGYVFLGIFVLTALLTLASLPGWIKIPENYRSQLFKALLLEVVGAIIILFGNEYLYAKPPEVTAESKIFVSPHEDWVAVDIGNSKIIQPRILVDSVEKKVLGKTKNFSDLFKNQELSIKSIKDQYNLINAENQSFGIILKEKLKENSFFNSLVKDNEKGVTKIRFNRTRTGWKTNNDFLGNSPFYIEMFENPGTYYNIMRKTDSGSEQLFSSKGKGDLLNRTNRSVHFHESDGHFNLFFIDAADNIDSIESKRYVRFVQVRLEPQVK